MNRGRPGRAFLDPLKAVLVFLLLALSPTPTGASGGPQTSVEAEKAFQNAEELRATGSRTALQAARREYQRALSSWQAAGNAREEAVTLNALGSVSQLLDEAAAALEYYQRALRIGRGEGETTLVIDSLNGLGVAAYSSGQTEAAVEHHQEALRLGASSGEDAGQAQALYHLGEISSFGGNKELALQRFRRALELWRSLDDPRGQAEALLNISYVYSDQGDLVKALPVYEEALGLWQAVGDRRGEARTLSAMGLARTLLGDYQQALGLQQRALDILESLGDRFSEAVIRNGRGKVFFYLRDPSRALEEYRRAAELFRAAEHQRGEGVALRHIGNALGLLGRHSESLDYYRRALTIGRQTDDPVQQCDSLRQIGQAYLLLGDPRQAQNHLEEALRLSQSLAYRHGTAQALSSLGRIRELSGEWNEALGLYREALKLNLATAHRAEESSTLFHLARVERRQGNLHESRSLIEKSIRIIESLRTGVASPELRATYFASARPRYELYLDLTMDLHGREPDRGFDRRAFLISERARARSLIELLAEADIDIREGIAPALKAREKELHSLISQIQGRYIRAHSAGEPSAQTLDTLERELDQVETEQEKLEAEIRRSHPGYAALRYPTPPDLQEVRKLLSADTAMLEYVLGEEASYLFVVTRQDFEIVKLPPAGGITESVRKLSSVISAPPRRTARLTYLRESRRLYQALVQPAQPQLADKNALIIVPDGILHYLPFEVLLSSGDGGRSGWENPQQWPYLVRGYAISYAPSAGVLAGLVDSGRVRVQDRNQLLAFGDPVYEGAEASGGHTTRGLLEDQPWKLDRLAYTREEVSRIAELYPTDQVALFLGDRALEQTVKEQIGGYRLVHFAVHGLLNDEKPQYSGLVLSIPRARADASLGAPLPSSPPGGEDGLLQVYEIFNLKLKADLIVLSACETGLGKQIRGEGLVGLTRAFLYAGAPAAVVSLWKVQDRSTAELMVRFYGHLNAGSRNRSEALRQAQLDLIGEGRFSHPYHWAPFVLVGVP